MKDENRRGRPLTEWTLLVDVKQALRDVAQGFAASAGALGAMERVNAALFNEVMALLKHLRNLREPRTVTCPGCGRAFASWQPHPSHELVMREPGPGEHPAVRPWDAPQSPGPNLATRVGALEDRVQSLSTDLVRMHERREPYTAWERSVESRLADALRKLGI